MPRESFGNSEKFKGQNMCDILRKGKMLVKECFFL